jgi:hypothetical protein
MFSRRLTLLLAGVIGSAAAAFPRQEPLLDAAPSDNAAQSDDAAAIFSEADKLLRGDKAKQARAALETILKDQTAKQSPARDRALYLHGFACLLLKDYDAAGRSLSQLAPFE